MKFISFLSIHYIFYSSTNQHVYLSIWNVLYCCPSVLNLKKTYNIGVTSHEGLFPCPRYRQLHMLKCLLHWVRADLGRRVQ